MNNSAFEWDESKEILNWIKHKVSFEEAQLAFRDTKRIIAKDLEHKWGRRTILLFWEN